jgi:hypothetical protein
MMHPWVASEGNSLQMLMAFVNILKKQLQAANKGWLTSVDVG